MHSVQIKYVGREFDIWVDGKLLEEEVNYNSYAGGIFDKIKMVKKK